MSRDSQWEALPHLGGEIVLPERERAWALEVRLPGGSCSHGGGGMAAARDEARSSAGGEEA